MVQITELSSSVYHKMLVKSRENQSIITIAALPTRRYQTPRPVWRMSPGYYRDLSGRNSKIGQGISIIQHFPRDKLNYIICFRKVENDNFFHWRVWFYESYVHRETPGMDSTGAMRQGVLVGDGVFIGFVFSSQNRARFKSLKQCCRRT